MNEQTLYRNLNVKIIGYVSLQVLPGSEWKEAYNTSKPEP